MPRKREDLASTVARVVLVSGIPRLDQQTYLSLFESLVDAVTEDGLTDGTRDVVARAVQARGQSVTTDEVRQVISALVADRVQLQLGVSAQRLRTVWYEYVVDLCKNAGLQLSDPELEEVSMWLRGEPA